jgi:small nuclear ribonucleoprotein (snRNP)-like protein
MLQELNRETEALYREVGASLVRVQLPKPRWMNDYAMAPINRDRIDPEVRKRLEQAGRQPAGSGMTLVLRPASAASSTQPSETASTQPVKVEGQGTIVFVPAQARTSESANQPKDAVLGGRLQMDVNTVVAFTPNNVGLLLDDAGHVLVPLYVERETCGTAPVHVALSDGKVLDAKFVGSDRQTNLTLLQIEKPAGKPVQLSAKKLVEGSLVLFISTVDGSGRLGMWNGGQQDLGIIFTTDGGVAGIARYGQFLGGASCHLIAEQLIHFGAVRRATLGVIVSEIRKDDPLREQFPVLGSRTAMRIDEVIAHSAADKSGLKPGDLLLALAGEPVSDIPSLAAAIASRNGATELQVLRGSEVLKLNVDLEQQK